jgi:glycosyltransferase involved in cell wall biosynthesis
VTHRPYCSYEVAQALPDYLEGVACCDAVFTISQNTLHEFISYAEARRLPHPHVMRAIWLPGQFASHRRVRASKSHIRNAPLQVVCVATLEPRKNHQVLIRAFRRVLAEHPRLDLRLTLIGNRYAGAEDLADWVVRLAAEEPRLSWLGSRPDGEVAAAIGGADFTVYPSLVEGFGLPVVESLWLGTPVLCHNKGVMAELAADGGCFTTDMTDESGVANGIHQLASDHELRARLTAEATARPIADWQAYGDRIAAALRQLSDSGRSTRQYQSGTVSCRCAANAIPARSR